MEDKKNKFIFNKKIGIFLLIIFVILILLLCVILAINNSSSGGACLDGKGCTLGLKFLYQKPF